MQKTESRKKQGSIILLKEHSRSLEMGPQKINTGKIYDRQFKRMIIKKFNKI